MGNLTVHRAAGGIKIQPEGATTTTGDGSSSQAPDDAAMSSRAGSGTSISTVATSSSTPEGDLRCPSGLALHSAGTVRRAR
jgi:hypothetical protein